MLRRIALLLFCFCGIFAAYMQYGFQQKALYELKDSAGEQWSATSVQLMLQCVANIVVALAVSAALRVGFGKNAGRIDVAPLLARGPSGAPTAGRALRYFVPIGLAYSLAMLSSNVALRYVSFSAQALAKSCKIIPVMLMRIVINKKRYTILQYACALMMTIGIAIYNFYKPGAKGDEKATTARGLALLFFSLACDGFTGPMQEAVRATFGVTVGRGKKAIRTPPSSVELMVKTNAIGLIVFVSAVLILGDWPRAMAFFTEVPKAKRAVLVLALTSAIGQNFIFLTIASFDSLVLTTMTTTRKFFTFFFSKPLQDLSSEQLCGSGLVFGGVALDLLVRYTSSSSAAAESSSITGGAFNKKDAGRTPFPGARKGRRAMASGWEEEEDGSGGARLFAQSPRRSPRIAATAKRRNA